MPLLSTLFFILCLGNAGTPLTLNFVAEFLCLYGIFIRHPLYGVLSCSSIVFSAGYTMFMFNRISFAGSYSRYFEVNMSDLNKREFLILLPLVVFTIFLGIYPAPILDGLHYVVSSLIYCSPIFETIPDSSVALFFSFLLKKNYRLPRINKGYTNLRLIILKKYLIIKQKVFSRDFLFKMSFVYFIGYTIRYVVLYITNVNV
jgi:formate hydrogenlyase subunit 3/multisubunit Na+/H+ antiporter MnhD subunit